MLYSSVGIRRSFRSSCCIALICVSQGLVPPYLGIRCCLPDNKLVITSRNQVIDCRVCLPYLRVLYLSYLTNIVEYCLESTYF